MYEVEDGKNSPNLLRPGQACICDINTYYSPALIAWTHYWAGSTLYNGLSTLGKTWRALAAACIPQCSKHTGSSVAGSAASRFIRHSTDHTKWHAAQCCVTIPDAWWVLHWPNRRPEHAAPSAALTTPVCTSTVPRYAMLPRCRSNMFDLQNHASASAMEFDALQLYKKVSNGKNNGIRYLCNSPLGD